MARRTRNVRISVPSMIRKMGTPMRSGRNANPAQMIATASSSCHSLILRPNFVVKVMQLTTELTHAGPKDAAREAELRAPSGVVCSDFVRRFCHGACADPLVPAATLLVCRRLSIAALCAVADLMRMKFRTPSAKTRQTRTLSTITILVLVDI